jgi:hypothetical protein
VRLILWYAFKILVAFLEAALASVAKNWALLRALMYLRANSKSSPLTSLSTNAGEFDVGFLSDAEGITKSENTPCAGT